MRTYRTKASHFSKRRRKSWRSLFGNLTGRKLSQSYEESAGMLIKTTRRDAYFLDFINLPPRSFKDYFAVIHDPLSLKGLQKKVKGIHGRKPPTGVSEFKSWAAFEDK